ncbi:MAG: hypothetical protein KC897_01385 [Candidatus Omnitrophica bacterium]|nr:hypothetical protein [Candidatus Omnitrophota bacterium]MCB9722141.1 hypothetical protein [Candidatus Omnitrophota bacterium]
MNLFDLKNNPNFLQCWRERNRPATVGSAVTLLIIIEAMIFTNAYFDDRVGLKSAQDVTPWFVDSISALAILQGIVLLFFGSVSAYRLSSRERTNRTIDFHRSSPTPRTHQILGLVLGSTSLEWWISLLILTVQVILALLNNLPPTAILQFYIQLALCAALYHALFALMGISRDPLKNKAGALVLFVGIYFLAHILVANKLSFVYQCTWLPAYEQLDSVLRPENAGRGWPHYGQSNQAELNYTLFGAALPALPFQMLVQIPFMALFLAGIGRRFTNVEQPVLSKSQLLTSAFYTFTLFTGSYVSLHFFSDDKHFRPEGYIVSLLILMMFFAIVGALMATPSHIGYQRGLRRARKLGIGRLNWAQNSSSNAVWGGLFCLLCAAVLAIYFHLFGTTPGNSVLASMILLGHIVFFVSFVEYFNLSAMHSKKPILFTVIVILWFLIPLFGTIISAGAGKMPTALVALFAPSPIFGVIETFLYLMEQKSREKFENQHIAVSITLIIIWSMAVSAVLLAAYERRRLKSLG